MMETNLEYARVIGEKLRAVRQQRKMSLRDLAEQANMSASMLSQIETGKAYPSVRSIYTIAAALALPVDYFFPDQDDAHPAAVENGSSAITASEMREALISRFAQDSPAAAPGAVVSHLLHADARPTIHLKGGVNWARLTAAAESQIEFLEIEYASGATSGVNLSYHEGREFGLILEGELVVQLGFDQSTMRVGDSIVFDSTTPHRLVNKSDQLMRALWVVWKG
jgi:transcriptional regulator with XRE-family HTH domain/mannose-6-phosphate isomerase-like protein (cupin superfamily)